jgi:hypothetical protein
LQLSSKPGVGSRTLFLAGVLEWSGEVPPTSASIAGARTLGQGQAHIVTIQRSGGQILGNRPLELDGIQADLFLGSAAGPDVLLQRGLDVIGRASADQKKTIPVLSTWGFGVPRVIASRAFCGGDAG